MSVPDITDEERTRALVSAMAARRLRAMALRDLRDGKTSAAEALESDDATWTRMRVSTFLRALPGIGAARALAIMTEAGIAENRRLGGLGRIQRARLVEALQELGIK